MVKYFFVTLIKFYQLIISPFLGKNCRFHPSCSEYAREAICKHSTGKALILSISRIFRCNPFSKAFLDPVPDKITYIQLLRPTRNNQEKD